MHTEFCRRKEKVVTIFLLSFMECMFLTSATVYVFEMYGVKGKEAANFWKEKEELKRSHTILLCGPVAGVCTTVHACMLQNGIGDCWYPRDTCSEMDFGKSARILKPPCSTSIHRLYVQKVHIIKMTYYKFIQVRFDPPFFTLMDIAQITHDMCSFFFWAADNWKNPSSLDF